MCVYLSAHTNGEEKGKSGLGRRKGAKSGLFQLLPPMNNNKSEGWLSGRIVSFVSYRPITPSEAAAQ
jgi:hypothetical protein